MYSTNTEPIFCSEPHKRYTLCYVTLHKTLCAESQHIHPTVRLYTSHTDPITALQMCSYHRSIIACLTSTVSEVIYLYQQQPVQRPVLLLLPLSSREILTHPAAQSLTGSDNTLQYAHLLLSTDEEESVGLVRGVYF